MNIIFIVYYIQFFLNDAIGDKKEEPKKKKAAPQAAAKALRRKKKRGTSGAVKIPIVAPNTKCKLRLLKLERIKDYLLMEEEYIRNQEALRPREEKNEVSISQC